MELELLPMLTPLIARIIRGKILHGIMSIQLSPGICSVYEVVCMIYNSNKKAKSAVASGIDEYLHIPWMRQRFFIINDSVFVRFSDSPVSA